MTKRGRIVAATFALVAAVGAACATTTVRSASSDDPANAALLSWGREHADAFARLSYDVSTVADDASTFNTAAMVGSCRTVANDVQADLALPAVPDAIVGRQMRSALELLGKGADDCIAGSVHGDSAPVVQASLELDQASAQLERARTLVTSTPNG